VKVSNALPFEKLTMDLKKTSENPPADQVVNGFSSLTTALGGLGIIQTNVYGMTAMNEGPPKLPTSYLTLCHQSPGAQTYGEIIDCQSAIETAFQPYNAALSAWSPKAVCMVHKLFQPLASTLATPNYQPDACSDYAITITVPKDRKDWSAWTAAFDKSYDSIKPLPADLVSYLGALDGSIADSKKHDLSPDQYLKVSAEETKIHAAFDSHDTLRAKMTGLHDAANAIAGAAESQAFTIDDSDSGDRNSLLPTWDLNVSNQMADIATRIKPDKYLTGFPQQIGALTDVPTKQNLVEITIQFMNPPRFEISAGIVFPIKPYHTYSIQLSQSAANAPSGSCPTTPADCGTVAFTDTTAFVPAALINVPVLPEYVRPGRRVALFLSGVIGYNTANTSAVFGGGPSLSFGSLVVNAPVVADRDQQLIGGFTVGQPAGTATTPMTKNVWRWSPSIGISIRVPLGSSGK